MQKILVISDSHGRDENIEEVVKMEQPLDMIIHLGDLEGSEEFMEETAAKAGCSLKMVAGNNDYLTSLPNYRVVQIGKHQVYLTHGHRYDVYFDYEALRYAARENGCDYVFFGHLHEPIYDTEGDIIVVNPGSISRPRQFNRIPSYAIVDVDDNGDLDIEIYYLR